MALCARHGLEGLFPSDLDIPGFAADRATSERIWRGNVALMAGADAIVANLTPFRGPSADVGTVFELAFMAATPGKLVLAYSNEPDDLLARLRRLHPGARRRADGRWAEPGGMALEDFGNAENLMVEEAVRAGGNALVRARVRPRDRWRDLAAFEECLAAARRHFGTG